MFKDLPKPIIGLLVCVAVLAVGWHIWIVSLIIKPAPPPYTLPADTILLKSGRFLEDLEIIQEVEPGIFAPIESVPHHPYALQSYRRLSSGEIEITASFDRALPIFALLVIVALELSIVYWFRSRMKSKT